MAERLLGTGMAAMDYLKALQAQLDMITNPEEKGDALQRALGRTSVEELAELMTGPVLLSAGSVVGCPLGTCYEDMEGSDDTTVYPFKAPLVFTGSIEWLKYLDSPRLAVDSLVVTLSQPDIISINQVDTGHFDILEFVVPVGGVNRCLPYAA